MYDSIKIIERESVKMKKMILSVFATVFMVLGLTSVATISPAYADILCPNGNKVTGNDYSKCDAFSNSNIKDQDLMKTLNTIINVIVGVVGFVSVAMIVIGGISFATSQGDTSKTTKARNTILYGVVGLVVALLAFAIVNFVLTNVFGGK